MNGITSYGKILSVGHKDIAQLFDGPFVIEEKIDGSQFSFSLGDWGLACRSSGKQLHTLADGVCDEKMFNLATKAAFDRRALLQPGWLYRCEYLSKPKHNTLAYSRVPKDNLILFDVMNLSGESFLDPYQKALEAERLGLECVPCYYEGEENVLGPGHEFNCWLEKFLTRESCLGGPIEGIVIKNYARFTSDGKMAKGKIVRPEFKEKHKLAWKVSNPSAADFVQELADSLRTEARWNKSIQHLREAGKLEGTPCDIGPLIKAVQADIEAEEAEQIKEALITHFMPKIKRASTAGLPEWYKKQIGIFMPCEKSDS